MRKFLLLIACMAFLVPAAARAADAFDADGDGYDDATELANGWSPFGPGKLDAHDADGDGLTDGFEISYGSDPRKADSDGDGYDDATEMRNGYDPLDASPTKAGKRIEIDLSEQKLTYYLGSKAVASHAVSTGRPGRPTPIGTFAVNDKIPRAWSARAKLWMPWWMPFIGSTYGLHELPEWPGGVKEGEDHLGQPVSGGCVRLGVGPAKELYDWVDVGTPVVIKT